MTAKDLKNALLQEAVQGKLVPQIASEGNARDLLEEIRKERLSHGLDFANAKSGKKSKKETALAGSNPCDIPEDEIPFDIPESWCWCRLGELVDFGKCQNAEPSEISDDAWILDLEDIEKDTGKIIQIKKKSEVDCKSTKHIFKAGYVLYSKLRPYLNKCVIATKDGFCTSEILPLNFGTHVYNRYAQTFLMSPFFVDYTNSLSFGVKMPRLGTEDGKKAVFPLPPLAEQKRIVAAIEKFMPLIEEYGKKETVLNELNAQIGTLTKKAILQEAVQGKLVPQIPAEGNAKDLLEEIRKERLSHGLDFANAKSKKKSKKETALVGSNPCDILEYEIPFDIPESWCWVRITDISTCELGKTKDAQKNTGILKDYLCSINIQEDGIDLSKVKQMKFEDSEFERYTVRKNDLLICEGGDAGRCAIYDRETPMHYQNALHRVRFFKGINPLFYLYILQLYKANNILMEASKGVTIQHLTGAALKSLLFPLPPLAEQKRIVETIEKMLPLCERLGK